MTKVLKREMFSAIAAIDDATIDYTLDVALKAFNRKIIVLDDDPTGVQTVNGVNVYTDWSEEAIESGFAEPNPMFFLLTNSRALSAEKTREVHQSIAERIVRASKKFNRKFVVISRSDSTLRGHYPLETEVVRETFEREGYPIDGEVLMPFFAEGGRFTINDVHYVQDGEFLIPAAETEFASDKTFGYTRSNLAEYIEEKSDGQYKASDVMSISINELRAFNVDEIAARLEQVSEFNKVIVNAVAYVDVKVFVFALVKAMMSGKNFLFRTAAALPKVLGDVSDRPLLAREELIDDENPNGGLIIVGSHVKKTTEQLNALKAVDGVDFIEFDVGNLDVEPIIRAAEESMSEGRTAVIYTSRQLMTLSSKEASLAFSTKISAALAVIVKRIKTRPRFLIAKGGITSSDVGTLGLGVKRALVLGQVKPGIPVWKLGAESKFPGMSYIIFPGNVGNVDTLRELVEMFNAQES